MLGRSRICRVCGVPVMKRLTLSCRKGLFVRPEPVLSSQRCPSGAPFRAGWHPTHPLSLDLLCLSGSDGSAGVRPSYLLRSYSCFSFPSHPFDLQVVCNMHLVVPGILALATVTAGFANAIDLPCANQVVQASSGQSVLSLLATRKDEYPV